MRRCAACKKEIAADRFIGRQEQCPYCKADLHCCLNCVFYSPGAYNDCKESQAERVLDKARSNFCDFFSFKNSAPEACGPSTNPKDKLEALFKK
jgi:hypothetical protein